MTTPTPTTTPVVVTASPTSSRDARTYWRVLLAVLAPCGAALIGLTNWLTPVPLAGTVGQAVAEVTAHRGLVEALLVPQLLFPLTFVPGAVALVVALRRSRPVLAAVLGSWMGLAGLLAAANPGSDLLVVAGLEAGLDPSRISEYVGLVSGGPWTTPYLIPFLLFITLGRVGVGVLFWKADVAPRWLAVLMMTSPFVEFAPLQLGNVQPALSWTMTAVAMTYVSVVLLHMSDDDFDLRPLS